MKSGSPRGFALPVGSGISCPRSRIADLSVQALAGAAAVADTTAVAVAAVATAGTGAGAVAGLGLALAARCAAFFLRSIQRPRRCRFIRDRSCCPISGVQYGRLGRKRQANLFASSAEFMG